MRYVEELGILPESQCGFRSGHSTADMTFTFRQLQEKCKEHKQDLYAVFIDLQSVRFGTSTQSVGDPEQDRLSRGSS